MPALPTAAALARARSCRRHPLPISAPQRPAAAHAPIRPPTLRLPAHQQPTRDGEAASLAPRGRLGEVTSGSRPRPSPGPPRRDAGGSSTATRLLKPPAPGAAASSSTKRSSPIAMHARD